MPTASQQINHLRHILTGLGMNSRPSLEQARAIKVRRELAQEIGMVLLNTAMLQVANGGAQRT